MLPSDSGKFLICIPRFSRRNERFGTVGRAVVRVAELLGADIEVSQRKNVLSAWVYYKNGGKEEIPVYFDWGKDWDEDDVFHSIRSKLHGLSHLPEHAILQVVRRR